MAVNRANQYYDDDDGKLVITNSSLLSKLSIAAGSSSTGDKTISKSGYYPIAIVGYFSSGTNEEYVNIYRLRMTGTAKGTATINYGLRNRGTAAASYTMSVDILWIKG